MIEDRIVILTGPTHPHEHILQAFALFVGAAYLIGAPPPMSIAASLPEWAIRIWSAGLLLSGLLSAASLSLRKAVEAALRLRQAAMLFGASGLVWAGYSIFAFAPSSRALLSGGFCLAWATANILRAEECRRSLLKIKRREPWAG